MRICVCLVYIHIYADKIYYKIKNCSACRMYNYIASTF